MAKKKSAGAAVAEPSTQAVTVEDAGPCRKKLTFEIGADKIASLLDAKFDSLAGGVALPGFRAGRAPRHLVEKRFGSAVREEARNELVAEAFQDAVKEHSLRVLGDPTAGDDLRNASLDGGPLKFSLEVEVAPEITLPSLEGLSVMRPQMEVADEMVQKEVDRLSTNEGSLEPRETCEAGDYCVGHGVMKAEDGKVVLDIPGAVIQSPDAEKKGEGMILGVKVKDFSKQLGTPRPGDAVAIKTTGPENHENEAVRGKPITVEYRVDEVHRIIPAKPDDLAKRFGMEGEQQLRDRIREQLKSRVQIEQQAAMREQVAKQLLEKVEFELPARITAQQAHRTLERRRLELMHRGVDAARIEERMADLRAASADVARRELKLFFILDAVATSQDVRLTEGEVNARIAQMAFSRQQRPEQLRAELIRTGQINAVAQQIREHKALDAVVGKASVKDVSVEEYRKAMGGAAEA